MAGGFKGRHGCHRCGAGGEDVVYQQQGPQLWASGLRAVKYALQIAQPLGF
jgi:hypothetical protein